MAKPRSVDAKLSRLRALRRETAVPEHVAELQRALGDRSNLVVAEAAEIAGERQLTDLAPDLVAAFDRFLVDPVQTDPLCLAKLAIVDALNKMDRDEEEVFLKGLRHVQREPRLAAVQALGQSMLPAAVALLRLKVRVGDTQPEVTAECLTALMNAAPRESLSFVAGFLDAANEVVQQGAAFALGESRRADALDLLKGYWPRARAGPVQEVILLAIAMTRLPAALDFLLEVLAGDDPPAASAALSALAIHRHNEALRERVAAVVARKKDAALQERFRKKFEARE
jgi:hypothetical protein